MSGGAWFITPWAPWMAPLHWLTMSAKLLVIDDENGILEEVKSYFEEEGFQVFTADSGEEGIQILKREKPDVLLVDMKLPDMSGLLVLKVAKESSPLTKVIVNTGYVDQVMIDQAEELGRDVFLQKPFDLVCLKKEVEKLLGMWWEETGNRITETRLDRF